MLRAAVKPWAARYSIQKPSSQRSGIRTILMLEICYLIPEMSAKLDRNAVGSIL